MKKIFIPVLIIIVVLTYFMTGFYNVSALIPHNALTESFAHITVHRSIRKHAKSITPPQLQVDKELLKQGFNIYDSKCAQCHSGPGIERSDIAKGMYPEPPRFPDDLEYDEVGEKEIFWTTKNGIKMSGMPSYDKTLDEKEMWALVKFIMQLPEITPEHYKDYRRTLIINF